MVNESETITITVPVNALLLSIRSEPYEVECEHCRGKGFFRVGDLNEFGIASAGNRSCGTCGGTGTRAVRLEGWVETWGWGKPGGRCVYRTRIKCKPVLGRDTKYYPTKAYELMEFINFIIQRYRDGTLPDEIRKNLREVTV